ncbi:hypothetical protein, partial [Bacteroides xylanisolvens]|uniref:hypothetical protein n=1 Tax=Bacteroides xylanisolvens TaxID=371601 RepID=UPI00195E880A
QKRDKTNTLSTLLNQSTTFQNQSIITLYLIHYYSSPSLLTNKLFFITDKLAFDEQITYLCVIANYK